MTAAANRHQLYEDLLRRLVAAMRGAQLYSRRHPLTARTNEALADTLHQIHAAQPSVTIGLFDPDVVVGGVPLPRCRESTSDFSRRLRARGIERIAIDRGVGPDEIARFLEMASGGPRAEPERPGAHDLVVDLPHIRAGRIRLDDSGGAHAPPAATTLRRLYEDAVSGARQAWESARAEGRPDLTAVWHTVDGLAEAVAEHRTALLGLTALKNHDNYTFTHMVNVSILTMGQARTLGVEGRLLREMGLAALMHDIGKVLTPLEILTKPEKLTDAEFAIMKRHVVDGAQILRQTPEIPPLAAVVAFEHHMRLDGRGYPDVPRRSLNLATMLCSISDVYDAMRSQRVYQESYPTDRVLAVLRSNDGHQFDQHLVRRFVRLLGIYPPGTVVRLSTGEVAVVTRAEARDPYRPRVLALVGPDGERLDRPISRDLYHPPDGDEDLPSVVSPVDAGPYGLDPAAYL